MDFVLKCFKEMFHQIYNESCWNCDEISLGMGNAPFTCISSSDDLLFPFSEIYGNIDKKWVNTQSMLRVSNKDTNTTLVLLW